MFRQIKEGTTLLEFYRQLMAAAPILNGKLLTCEFEVADGTVKTFAHGLGRMPRGNFIVSNSAPGSAYGWCGLGDQTHIGIRTSASADVVFTVWVF